jgi:hypothetical protein
VLPATCIKAALESAGVAADGVDEVTMYADDLQKEFARNANIPTASDVNGLVERLRGTGQPILTRPDDRDERLRAIEGRLKG